jgi:hypothetical protein
MRPTEAEKLDRQQIESLWRMHQKHIRQTRGIVKTVLLWLGILAFFGWLFWWIQGVAW